jgi:splicing factor 3A subunit 3
VSAAQHKSKITIDLKVNKYLELIQDRSNKLRAIYEDKDNLRRDDISRITGQGPEVFSAFYDTMREMRGYYAKFPDMTIEKPEDVAYKLVMEDDERTLPHTPSPSPQIRSFVRSLVQSVQW